MQLDYTKSQEVIAEIEAELKQLELQTTQTEQQYLDNLNQVSQLQTQLRELDNKAVQFNQQNLALRTQGDRELQDVNREIARLKQQIEGNSQIVSTQAGCITELNASLGQVLESGTRLGYLQTTVDKPALKSLSYLAVKDGKRIKGGLTMIPFSHPSGQNADIVTDGNGGMWRGGIGDSTGLLWANYAFA